MFRGMQQILNLIPQQQHITYEGFLDSPAIADIPLTLWRLTIYIYVCVCVCVCVCRTAQLTSRRCILNIYSTNILTEYFKHAAYSPFFLFKMPFIS